MDGNSFLSVSSSENLILCQDLLIHQYSMMVKIRTIEDEIAERVGRGEIICPCHLYAGQEAVATAVCSTLTNDDWVFSNHRSHGHYIAKGGDCNKFIAEIYCRESGCSKGRGGSMHLTSPETGFPGSSAIVSSTIPLAVGVAYSFQIKNCKNLAVSFFGDGATNEGVFYESLNLAALKKLPVLFVCENNLYSTHMPISQCLANTNIFEIAQALNIPSVRIDGNDVIGLYKNAKKAVDYIKNGNGPVFIECMTYRLRGHVGPNDDIDKGLRSQSELDLWKSLSPITRLEKYLIENNFSTKSKLNHIKTEIRKNIQKSFEQAKKAPSPNPEKSLSIKNVFKGSEKN